MRLEPDGSSCLGEDTGQSLSCGGAREIITADGAERHKGDVRKHS